MCVGTLYAGGREFFLLDQLPIQCNDAGATFRCVEKNGKAFNGINSPVLHVTAKEYAIVREEDEEFSWDEIHDAILVDEE